MGQNRDEKDERRDKGEGGEVDKGKGDEEKN